MYDDLEMAAATLERSGDYKVLRRLQPRTRMTPGVEGPQKQAIIVDVETTGLLPERDEIIELGMIKFSYTSEGLIHEIIDTFTAFREPSASIPSEITRLTGITNDMVAGHSIDLNAIEAFLSGASVIIAHNAAFDRPFCEAAWPIFHRKPWACSSGGINWRMRGHAGRKLGYLLYDYGLFHNSHRALDDCRAVMELLSRSMDSASETPLAELLARARQSTVRLFADSVPFNRRDFLKRRGYRWSNGDEGRPKAWWKDVMEHDIHPELSFLRAYIYEDDNRTVQMYAITAYERFSQRHNSINLDSRSAKPY